MNTSDVFELLNEYGPLKIAISAIVLIITAILEKVVKNNSFKRLSGILPFAIAISICAAASLLFPEVYPIAEAFNNGVTCGCLVIVVRTVFEGFLLRGEFENVPIDSLVIESVLAGYVPDDVLPQTAEECAEILRVSTAEPSQEKVKSIIIGASKCISPAEADFLVKIIINVITATQD